MSELKPVDLWSALSAPAKPHRVVDFPRKDLKGNAVGQLAIIVLRHEDSQICIRAADAFVRKALELDSGSEKTTRAYDDLYINELAVQILFRACKDVSDLEKPAFPSPKAMKLTLSDDEIAVLFRMYEHVRVEIGPIISRMSGKELNAYLDRLVEGGQSFPLGFLSLDMLQQLLMHSVSQRQNSPTDKSSVGEQQLATLPESDSLGD